GSDLAVQMAHGFADSLDIGDEFGSPKGLLEKLVDFHRQDDQELTSTVVKFAGDITALFIAGAHELPGEFLQLASAGADLGVERLGEAAVFVFADAERFVGTDLGGDIAGDFGSSGDVSC